MIFTVLLEKTGTGYCAHSPDVPGVVAAHGTIEETLEGFRNALGVLFDLIRREGGELPVPKTIAATVEVEGVA